MILVTPTVTSSISTLATRRFRVTPMPVRPGRWTNDSRTSVGQSRRPTQPACPVMFLVCQDRAALTMGACPLDQVEMAVSPQHSLRVLPDQPREARPKWPASWGNRNRDSRNPRTRPGPGHRSFLFGSFPAIARRSYPDREPFGGWPDPPQGGFPDVRITPTTAGQSVSSTGPRAGKAVVFRGVNPGRAATP
jgi:hypothetical protein